jgi:GDPmannose 4,6-dehydratase
MTNKIAFITGITGQDGAYLTEILLTKGYEVHGLQRRSSSINTDRIAKLYEEYHPQKRFFLHYGDMTDSTNIIRLIQDINPSEIYNLAAQSHVQVSFETPEYTANADALGALRILEFIKHLPLNYMARYKPFRKMNQPPFIPEAPMPLLNYMPIGLPLIIVKLMACMLLTEFYLTMKVLYGVKLL